MDNLAPVILFGTMLAEPCISPPNTLNVRATVVLVQMVELSREQLAVMYTAIIGFLMGLMRMVSQRIEGYCLLEIAMNDLKIGHSTSKTAI